MNRMFRKSLLAGAIAALAAAPVWAGGDAGKYESQSGSTYHKMERSEMGASSRVHSMTPSQLRGTDVVGPSGEEIGTVKAVVRSRQEGNIQAVISSGGVAGLGAKEVAVPLDSLRYRDGKLQTAVSESQLKARPEFRSEQYVELQPTDQPISEFSAFEADPRGASDRSRRGMDESRSGTRWGEAGNEAPYPQGDRVTP